MCTLYVALTRARFACYAYVHEKQKTALTLGSILVHGLNAQHAEYSKGDPYWYLKQSGNQEQDQGSTLAAPENLEHLNRPPRFLKRRSPSDTLSGSLLSLTKIPPLQSNPEHGIKVHKLLSKVEWLDEMVNDASEVSDILGDGDIKRTLLKAHYFDKWKVQSLLCKREEPFAFVKDDLLITGTFDRLILGVDSQGRITKAEIIDYKTDSSSTDIQALVARYAEQLNLYRDAVMNMYSLNREDVECYIAGIKLNRMAVIA